MVRGSLGDMKTIPTIDHFLYGDIRTYKNNRLSHWNVPNGIYFVTFNVADALPAPMLAKLRNERETIRNTLRASRGRLTPQEQNAISLFFIEECESELDRGRGSCIFRNAAAAGLMRDVLHHFNHERYELFTWSIMPNHLHVIFQLLVSHNIDAVMHSWKSYSSKEQNRILGREGQLWQEGYFDRTIRNRDELKSKIAYVLNNPARAGLADWPWVWSSPEAIAAVVGHL